MKTMELQIERAGTGEHGQRTERTRLIERIRAGMEVRSSDGVRLGKILEVWCGQDPASGNSQWDEEVCSRLEVNRRGNTPIYVPYRAVAEVSGKRVTLGVDARTATSKGWNRKPKWIPHGEKSGILMEKRLIQSMATSLQRC